MNLKKSSSCLLSVLLLLPIIPARVSGDDYTFLPSSASSRRSEERSCRRGAYLAARYNDILIKIHTNRYNLENLKYMFTKLSDKEKKIRESRGDVCATMTDADEKELYIELTTYICRIYLNVAKVLPNLHSGTLSNKEVEIINVTMRLLGAVDNIISSPFSSLDTGYKRRLGEMVAESRFILTVFMGKNNHDAMEY